MLSRTLLEMIRVYVKVTNDRKVCVVPLGCRYNVLPLLRVDGSTKPDPDTLC